MRLHSIFILKYFVTISALVQSVLLIIYYLPDTTQPLSSSHAASVTFPLSRQVCDYIFIATGVRPSVRRLLVSVSLLVNHQTAVVVTGKGTYITIVLVLIV